MPYPPAIVANAVLYRARQRGLFISHLKLQKLVFFTHAWGLAILDTPFVEERPEAWSHGPVFGSLFYRLKDLGHQNISDYIETVDGETNTYQTLMPSSEDADFWSILDQVMARYGCFTALQLSALGHESGGPWEQARKARQALIADDAMRSFYQGKLQ
jgi:uncharacterized phage-associated protein